MLTKIRIQIMKWQIRLLQFKQQDKKFKGACDLTAYPWSAQPESLHCHPDGLSISVCLNHLRGRA